MFVYPQCLDNLAGPGFLPERVGSLTGEAHQEAVRDLVVNNKFLNKAWVNISCIHLRSWLWWERESVTEVILVWDRECKDRLVFVFFELSAVWLLPTCLFSCFQEKLIRIQSGLRVASLLLWAHLDVLHGLGHGDALDAGLPPQLLHHHPLLLHAGHPCLRFSENNSKSYFHLYITH